MTLSDWSLCSLEEVVIVQLLLLRLVQLLSNSILLNSMGICPSRIRISTDLYLSSTDLYPNSIVLYTNSIHSSIVLYLSTVDSRVVSCNRAIWASSLIERDSLSR